MIESSAHSPHTHSLIEPQIELCKISYKPISKQLFDSKRPRTGNLNFPRSTSTLTPKTFHLSHYVHALCDFSKDSVLPVEPGGIGGANEELRAVLRNEDR